MTLVNSLGHILYLKVSKRKRSISHIPSILFVSHPAYNTLLAYLTYAQQTMQ
jgi:hypothetical protein